MPRGGKRAGSGPKPLSVQGRVPGPTNGRFTLTALEAEALTEELEHQGTWHAVGSPEWVVAINRLAVKLLKKAIHELPYYQDVEDNRTHMAALTRREQVDE